MPEHDETTAGELEDDEELAEEETWLSATPDLRIPKTQRWRVENK